MLRCRPDDDDDAAPQKTLGWSGFNAAASSTTPAPSVVGYCPVIEASPTELLSVYTRLKKSMEMGRKLGLDEIIIVINLAICAKAQYIVWKQQEEFGNVILGMGAFHTSMTIPAVIGKRFRDDELSDHFIEAGIVATGSVA